MRRVVQAGCLAEEVEVKATLCSNTVTVCRLHQGYTSQ